MSDHATDDLDDELRSAMKVLDGEAPSGYFDALPERTLARLRLEETEAMQTSGMGPTRMSDNDSASGVPPMADANRDEDSGLHDIRSLASSTKLRMSKRIASVPPPMDEDVLASSSAGWKNVALPEPARMVSLPELSSLPTATEVRSKDKAARKAAKETPAAAAAAITPVDAGVPTATATATTASASAATASPVIGARFAAKPKTASRTPLYAAIGIAVAAAAGGLVVWKLKSGDSAPTQVASAPEAVTAKAEAPRAPAPTPAPAPVAAATATPIESAPAPGGAPPIDTSATGAVASASEPASTGDERHRSDAKSGKKPAVASAAGGASEEDTGAKPDKIGKAAKPPAAAPGAAAGSGEADPSFDALLKEAGVDANKPKTVVLEKKSLSSGDIKTGMGAVAGKAQGCYAGQQGTASVKLTVAPSGKVTKAAVTGAFAGTPVAACVESAVKSAQFPAWDGGPQTVSYSYLLAE